MSAVRAPASSSRSDATVIPTAAVARIDAAVVSPSTREAQGSIPASAVAKPLDAVRSVTLKGHFVH